ncbi:MAG: hypothetical protein KDA28_16460, partial [Phycisphaerales bacterium]|nr:hypothetical protein [Phycisphaerales bacterium]
SVGVTGTHGKGTTSAMITRILDAADRDPGFIIGGILNDYGLNARAGSGDVIVAEVDDSDGTHRNVHVSYLLVNYLEADHLNYYDDLDHIISSMAEAIEENPRLRRAFVNGDCAGNQRLAGMVSQALVTYGTSDGCAYRGRIVEGGVPLRFEAFRGDTSLGEFTLPVPGRYNVINAMGAIALCDALDVPVDAMRAGLANFHGLENRFTIIDAAGVKVVKDYNSHPTAIRKVLESASELTDGRIISIFKPYRYTLTHYLKDEYATAFHGSHEVVITTMYAANEDPIPGIDTEFVVDMLRRNGLDVAYIPVQEDILAHLDATVRDGDKVIFFGGDDFFRMADAWAARRNGGAS